MPAPPFDQAVSRFKQFLESQGWPTEIVWARQNDVVWQGESLTVRTCEAIDAKVDYDLGQRAGLGVLLEARCTLGNLTSACVCYPQDEREAELLLYPSDGSLKLSVAVPKVEGLNAGAASLLQRGHQIRLRVLPAGSGEPTAH